VLLYGFASLILATPLIYAHPSYIMASNATDSLRFFSNLHVLNVLGLHWASQGIATDNNHIFLTTSINEAGKRENIISVYTMDGKYLMNRRNASITVDRDGRPMDFGDASVNGPYLYVALYNWHALPVKKSPMYSKVAVFYTKNLSLVAEYDIGANTAEGISYSGGYYWVTFHDKPLIKKFDTDFRLIKTFSLQIPSNVDTSNGYFQGMAWYGNEIFVNIHGPNTEGSFYSPGVLRYHYDGSNFDYIETLTPPTYGSGQGLDILNNTFYFVDRTANVMIKADLIVNRD
jgi:hypothetical protein